MQIKQKKPSTLKYILAWVLAGKISYLLNFFVNSALLGLSVKSLNDLNFYFFLSSIISTLIVVMTFIAVYNVFSSLNIKRVMIFIYFSGGLSLLLGIGTNIPTLEMLPLKSSIYFLLSLSLTIIVTIYIIRLYFKRKPERWH